MATKKTGGYRIIRDCAAGTAGDLIDLDDYEANLLVRDGMVRREEGDG